MFVTKARGPEFKPRTQHLYSEGMKTSGAPAAPWTVTED